MTTRIAYFLIDAADVVSMFSILLAVFTDQVLNAYLEDPDDPDGMRVADDMLRTTAVELPERWPQGRLFTWQADLRWERIRDAGLHAVMITEKNLPINARDPQDLTPVGDGTCKVLLWGEYRHDAWREERIPRLNGGQVVYPRHWNGPFAAIITRQYELPLPAPARHPEFAGVRRVVRYLAYDGNVQFDEPEIEPDEEEQE